MPIMVECVSGAPINAINFDAITAAWSLSLFFTINPVLLYNLYGSNLLDYILMLLRVKSWVPFFSLVFSEIMGCRDLFGDIVNLLQIIDLLMHDRPLVFLVFSYNIYGGIFYQMYLLSQLTILFSKLGAVEFWRCCSWLLDHLNIFIRMCISMLLLS